MLQDTQDLLENRGLLGRLEAKDLPEAKDRLEAKVLQDTQDR